VSLFTNSVASLLSDPSWPIDAAKAGPVIQGLANAQQMLVAFPLADPLWPIGRVLVFKNTEINDHVYKGELTDPVLEVKTTCFELHSILQTEQRILKFADSQKIAPRVIDRVFRLDVRHTLELVQDTFTPTINSLHVVHTDRNRVQMTFLGRNLESIIRPLALAPFVHPFNGIRLANSAISSTKDTTIVFEKTDMIEVRCNVSNCTVDERALQSSTVIFRTLWFDHFKGVSREQGHRGASRRAALLNRPIYTGVCICARDA